MKNLPIGIQNFPRLIGSGDLYIDKTARIHQLISTGSTYFLSRPRRFGKSLLISTLEAIFKGQRELFDGLAIADLDWAWDTHPVIRIDFSKLNATDVDSLNGSLQKRLCEIASHYDIALEKDDDIKWMFDQLIYHLSKQGAVVILIDEYDKPIINHLGNDIETAKKNRLLLRDFFEVIKANDEYLKFVFLTGITKFSQMSVFSGLNNLNNISMDDEYADLLGCTEAEIDRYFPEHVNLLANAQNLTLSQTREKMRQWYNGFRFAESDVRVYTPYSILLLFNKNRFKNYWFETATPNFLVNLIRNENYEVDLLEAEHVTSDAFASFELDQIDVTPLLVQTGYLTIKAYYPETDDYSLGYPNQEVRLSFQRYLLKAFVNVVSTRVDRSLHDCVRYLEANELDKFFDSLHIFFANISYELHVNHERYYQSIFFLAFSLMGMNINTEVKTNRGSIDAVIETRQSIYVIEFKFNGTAKKALAQIHERGYYEKYRGQGKPIILVGVNFDQATRNMDDYVIENLA